MLGRDPEPFEVSNWLPNLLHPLDVTPRLFLRSPEFQALASCRDTDALRAFVTRPISKP